MMSQAKNQQWGYYNITWIWSKKDMKTKKDNDKKLCFNSFNEENKNGEIWKLFIWSSWLCLYFNLAKI